jgi:anti-sigma factor RsiW
MMDKEVNEPNIVCRQARKHFAVLNDDARASTSLSITERTAATRHLQTCARCALEYRLYALQMSTLDAAAADPIAPDEDFFRGVRARIARGPEVSPARPTDESWAAALLATARQLVPAMAVLLLLMLGATLLWNRPTTETGQLTSQAAVRPRERVVFPDMYDYPEPTRDDVLETLVAIEEKENGK